MDGLGRACGCVSSGRLTLPKLCPGIVGGGAALVTVRFIMRVLVLRVNLIGVLELLGVRGHHVDPGTSTSRVKALVSHLKEFRRSDVTYLLMRLSWVAVLLGVLLSV